MTELADKIAALMPRPEGNPAATIRLRTLPDRAQFEVENDLARVLPSRLVAAGVEIEDPWLDPELLGDGVDDRDRYCSSTSQSCPRSWTSASCTAKPSRLCCRRRCRAKAMSSGASV